ncbi:FAD:protein FMN transferase [Oxalobacteraceae bacterium A2-2]
MRRVLLPHSISADPAPQGAAIHDLRGLTMGTSWSVRLAASSLPAGVDLQAGLQAQLDAVVAEMSHWEADSDLGRYNRAPAGSWQQLPPAFYDVLSFALSVARDSGGAYDPCAGSLVNLWGFGPHGRHGQPDFVPPGAGQVAAACAELALRRVAVDPASRRALQPGGVQLDLSAVAKGYGVDRLAYYLKSQGIAHFLVEVGGELRGAGVKPDGQPWWVMLEQPPHEDRAGAVPDEIVLALHGLSVATSGDYRRYFLHGGRRYAHTIDPRSGRPVDNRLASVTVVHPHCMAADAWSTALYVLGPQAGLALAERLGLAVRFVVRTETAYTESMSPHFRSMLNDE